MSVYIIDTETSDRKNGELVEFASIFIKRHPDGGDLIPDYIRTPCDPEDLFAEEWVQRYNPQRMSMGALAVHHILMSELAVCPPAHSFIFPSDCAYMIGHSIDFDWEVCGSPPDVRRIDTHPMSQHLWQDATSFSQSALLYMLDCPTEETRERLKGAHGALCDARNNQRLLAHILIKVPHIVTWPELWEYSEECRVPIFCPLKRWDGVRLEEMDDSSIDWCLRQGFIDPHFRKGLVRVMDARYPPEPQEPAPAPPQTDLFKNENEFDDDIPF